MRYYSPNRAFSPIFLSFFVLLDYQPLVGPPSRTSRTPSLDASILTNPLPKLRRMRYYRDVVGELF